MFTQNRKNLLLFIQFMISLISIFGSLYFSEIMNFPPCSLCWYQRLFIYPIALIILSGFFWNSQDTSKIVAPFTAIGLMISIYHNLIYYKFIQIIIPCSESSPCTAQQLNYLGFITIPLLSLAAFVTLFILSLITLKIEFTKETYEK